MDSEQCLNVFVGCPPPLRMLPKGPCLIIDADQDVLDAFEKQYPIQDHAHSVIFQSKVLAGPDVDGLIWRRFNDSRFNGVWDLNAWFEIAPNLHELDQYSVEPTTFSSVLEQSSLIGDSWDSIRLFLRQGDPVQILQGVDSLLKYCTSILLRYPGIPREMEVAFEGACSDLGFICSDVDQNAWIPKQSEWSEINVMDLVVRKETLMEIAQAFFDPSSYRQICPGLEGLSDSDLLEHWLKSSDPLSLMGEMRRQQLLMSARFDDAGGDPLVKALRSLFPFEFYRSLRPDLNSLDDNALLSHYCSSGLNEGVCLQDGVEMQYAIEALRKIFPYDLYRQLSPDLSGLSDQSLLIYFCAHDLRGGIDLSEDSVRRFVGSYPTSEVESLRVRVRELESYLKSALNHSVGLQPDSMQVADEESD